MSKSASQFQPTVSDSKKPDAESDNVQQVSALSPRALVVGILCVVMTPYVVCYAELLVGKIQIGYLQLPPVVIGMLVLLLTVQTVLSRMSKRLRLHPHELFTVYVMMLLTSMISSRGLLQKLIPLLVTPNYYATVENGWKRLFFGSIKEWAVPFNPAGGPKQDVAMRFFERLRPGEPIPWELWVRPLCAWGVFVGLMFFAYLCLAVILRRQWVDNEKLTFPLVQLPLEMVRGSSPDGSPSFLRNRLTWFGFAIPALFFGFNGLHQWYPSIPDFQSSISLNQFFTQPPWDGMGNFTLYISFAAVGFFYLLPTDLLFSLWFFFLITKFEGAAAVGMGYQPTGMPMYTCYEFIGYQIMGCYLVLVGFMIHSARPHLARVWRAATARQYLLNGEERGDDELLSYRAAFWGLAASFLLAAGWMTLLGMSYWLALFELGVLLFLIALVMARSTSESGMLMTETSFRPVDMYRMVGDVRNLGTSNLTAMAFLDAMWLRDQRGLILTGFLDSMKFADGVKVSRRSLLGVFGLTLVLAIGVAGYLHVSMPYHYGAEQMYHYVYSGNANWAFTDTAAVMGRSRGPLSPSATINFGVGAMVTLLISFLRTRAFWFPLHPLGYALSGTWTMIVFWFPCLVAWLLKVFILRYGGMKFYTIARPFFLGLVLGEFTTAILFTIPALFDRFTPTPTFPWS